MRLAIVRYRVKPDRVEEHEVLVRAVFDELRERAPAGLRYAASKQTDGVSFVHSAFLDAEDNPLPRLVSFRAFVQHIAERCDEPPVTTELSVLGAYGL